MLRAVYNSIEVNPVMETSKLISEVKKLSKQQLLEFNSYYIQYLRSKNIKNDYVVVGQEYDFWREEEDLYDDLLDK